MMSHLVLMHFWWPSPGHRELAFFRGGVGTIGLHDPHELSLPAQIDTPVKGR